MDLQNRKQLKSAAKDRLSEGSNAVKISLLYAAIIVGASLLTNGAQMLLNSEISQTGGLQNLGLRSVLSTIQTILPIILNFLLMCLSLGFTGVMLRISRKQYVSINGLRIGFDRFWVLLRATLLQGGLYLMAAMAAYILSMQIFFLTPMSRELLSVMAPMLKGSSNDVMAILENPAVLEQLASSMLPLYGIMIVIFLALAAPVYYRYILTPYLLIDHPRIGALAAMHQSRMLMRKHCMDFLKLDISLWPYYISSLIAMVICYGATILTLLAVPVPISPMALSMICFGVYLVLTFLITLFLQPHMEVTHALAYESLLPKTQPSGGVVLGNIFDLAREQMNDLQ